MLPDPTLTFTVPSLHDGLALDCRVYHPASLATNPRSPPWKRHAAVIAHPYAPLGGCYDDPTVEVIAGQLLRKGFLVGTFNFRGAGNSAGRTSWTAKPEREDYISFVGFIIHYVHYLDPYRPHDEDTALQSSQPNSVNPRGQPPVLLLGGYSYGAMVTSQLPPLDTIIQPFLSPTVGSDAAEIRLRAEHLAERQNIILGSARSAMMEHKHHRSHSSLGVRIGGDESGSPRRSHESHGRRSFSADAEDKIRRGVGELMSKARAGRSSHRSLHHEAENSTKSNSEPDKEGPMPAIKKLIFPQPAYLMISPLQGLITHLATMSLVPTVFGKTKEPGDEAAEEKLVRHPALAVYGDKDVFVAVNKLRAWTNRLTARPGSQFRAEEITTAGHFWVEEGVLYRMRDLVGEFADRLLQSR